MNFITKYFFYLLAFWSIGLYAQTLPIECGTFPKTEWVKTLQQKVQNGNNHFNKTNQLTLIPLQIHHIVKSNGFSTITIQQIRNEIDSVNYFYANANMFFYECSAPDIIYDDSLYNYEFATEEPILLNQYYTNDVINIYFANTASVNGTLVCGYSQFPPSMDYAVISAGCATNGSTLAHEIGHYFGLFHTHGDISQGELVDGSNCNSDGDLICDTPADPILSSTNVNSSCIYTGTAVDANFMTYMPDVSNIMSYSRKYCRYTFSPDQYGVINSTMLNERSNLYCSSVTGIKSQTLSNYKIYPNPGNNSLFISLSEINELAEFKIINSLGQCLQSIYFSDKNIEINTKDLATGIYFYILKIKDNSFTGKWVKSEQ